MTYLVIIRKDLFTTLSLAISNIGCGTRIPMEDADMNRLSAHWTMNDIRDCPLLMLYYGHWSVVSSAGKKHNDPNLLYRLTGYLIHDAACWITFNSFVGTFRNRSIAIHLEDVFMWSQRYMRIMRNDNRKGEIGCWSQDRILQVSFTSTSDCVNDGHVEFLITLANLSAYSLCYVYIYSLSNKRNLPHTIA